MAKKKNSSKEAKQGRTDSVRSAAAQAIEVTAGQAVASRERAQQLADDLAQAANRVREALDDLRPPTGDDVRSLREQIGRLEARVAELERPRRATTRRRTTAAAAAKAPAKRTPAKRTTAKRAPRASS
jgi:polyhydroxyalkanoate synthesis regulator phasin